MRNNGDGCEHEIIMKKNVYNVTDFVDLRSIGVSCAHLTRASGTYRPAKRSFIGFHPRFGIRQPDSAIAATDSRGVSLIVAIEFIVRIVG